MFIFVVYLVFTQRLYLYQVDLKVFSELFLCARVYLLWKLFSELFLFLLYSSVHIGTDGLIYVRF